MYKYKSIQLSAVGNQFLTQTGLTAENMFKDRIKKEYM